MHITTTKPNTVTPISAIPSYSYPLILLTNSLPHSPSHTHQTPPIHITITNTQHTQAPIPRGRTHLFGPGSLHQLGIDDLVPPLLALDVVPVGEASGDHLPLLAVLLHQPFELLLDGGGGGEGGEEAEEGLRRERKELDI